MARVCGTDLVGPRCGRLLELLLLKQDVLVDNWVVLHQLHLPGCGAWVLGHHVEEACLGRADKLHQDAYAFASTTAHRAPIARACCPAMLLLLRSVEAGRRAPHEVGQSDTAGTE